MSDAQLSPRPRRLSISGAFALLAIAAVLVVVSVPRLHVLAQQENEVDARNTALLLARALRTHGASAERPPSLADLLGRAELGGLADSELLERDTVLRRHGYLFEITSLSPAVRLMSAPVALLCGTSASLPTTAIRAWPWTPGASGGSSFLVTAEGALFELPGSGARAQGPAGAVLIDPESWKRAR
jgi:hypothetical protein